MNDTLRPLRDRIDAIDLELLRLLNERAGIAQEIGHLKNGIVYRAEREAQVVRRLQAANAGPLPAEAISVLFKEIMSSCRALEQPLSVAYLGPQGTFSEAAALKHFGHAVDGVAAASIDEVFRAVEQGSATFAVAPVENSSEGAVNRTLDLLLGTELKICGEVNLRIRQHLMRSRDDLGACRTLGSDSESRPRRDQFSTISPGNSRTIAQEMGEKWAGAVGLQPEIPKSDRLLDGLEVVYSHEQSLGQCHEWLSQHLPGVKTIRVTSNAEAARLAAANPDAAAIAGEVAAERYDLKIVARDIEDNPHNTTRFLVLGREEAAPSGVDKTSLILSTSNRPGALLELLAPLASHGIGLTRLESRPARNGSWEYVFYVDIEGHRQSDNIQAALAQVESHCRFLKVLGSYPVAV